LLIHWYWLSNDHKNGIIRSQRSGIAMFRFSLNQLRYFSAVARHGTIAGAARHLNVSTAGISAALDTVEAQTGLVLFDRFPAKGLSLTGAGAEFLEQATVVLHEAEKLQAKSQALASPETGEIRFACYHAFALIFGAEILRDYLADWPGVSVSLIEGDMPRLRDLATQGQADVLLTYKDAISQADFETQTVMQVAPRVILPATHPLARHSRIRVPDLSGLNYVKVDEPDSGESYLDMIKTAGYKPQISQVVTSYELARSCVGAGMGFTLLAFTPRNADSYLGDSRVASPVEEDVGHFTVELSYRTALKQSDVIRRFCDLSERVVQGLGETNTG
jgi:DNA-binding transcriptional LysR family regulator